MTKVVGSNTTKAEEQASLKAARTRHRVGPGQLFIQPTAHADREAALIAAAEKLDDFQEEVAAINFVKVPAPIEAQQMVRNVRPTAPYVAKSSPAAREAQCLECGATHRFGSSCAPKIAGPAPVVEEYVWVKGWKVRTGQGFATEKQAKWMVGIAERPSVTPEMRESLRLRLEQGFARTAASAFITKYKDIPQEITPAQAAAGHETSRSGAPLEAHAASAAPVEVEEGRYAVKEDGVLKFFRITKGKGRWAGRTFVEIQASDDRYAVRNRERVTKILASIAENPLEAEQRYGQELGKCSRCGRTLTDETSRAYGIGPDCRSKR